MTKLENLRDRLEVAIQSVEHAATEYLEEAKKVQAENLKDKDLRAAIDRGDNSHHVFVNAQHDLSVSLDRVKGRVLHSLRD